LEVGGGHVIHVANRTVTGSVESLPKVVEALAAGKADWATVVSGLGERAQDRAEIRDGSVADHLAEPEAYGVSRGV
jgi:hypothetical protein